MSILDELMGEGPELAAGEAEKAVSQPDVKIGNANACLNNVHQSSELNVHQSGKHSGIEPEPPIATKPHNHPNLPPVALCPACHSDTIWVNAFGKSRCYDCHPPKSPGLARSVLVASVSDSGEGEWVEWGELDRTRENGSQGPQNGFAENGGSSESTTEPREISKDSEHWPKRVAHGLLQPSPLLPWVVDPAWRRAREEEVRAGSTDEELAGLIYGVEGEGDGEGGGGGRGDLPHILPDPRRTWSEPFLVEDFMPLVKDFTKAGSVEDRHSTETLPHPARSAERSEAPSNPNAQAAGPIAGGARGSDYCEALATTIATDANAGYWSQHPAVAGLWVRVKLAVARVMVEG